MAKNIDLREHKETILIVAAIAIALFFSKKIWDTNKTKIAGIKQQIQVKKESASLANDIRQVSKDAEKYKKLAWNTKESVVIMGQINELATKYNIDIFSFDPGTVQNKNTHFELTLSLNLGAQYQDFINFLVALESLPTLTKIKNVNISPSGKQTNESARISAFLVLEAYIIA